MYFATTGLLQGSNISFGIKTTTPFQYFGHPDFSGEAIADALNERDLPGVYFVPKYYQAALPSENGLPGDPVLCDGVMTVIHDRKLFRPVTAQLHIIDVLNILCPDTFDVARAGKFANLRMGTDRISELSAKKESLLSFAKEWEEKAEEFKKRREPYLLY